MKGQILDFNIQSSSGLISAEDGKRYSFAASEWKDAKLPNKGMRVDFDISDGKATAVYLAIGATGQSSPAASDNSEEIGWCKSTDDKVLGGVCGGIARKLKISSSGCRVVTALLSFFFFLPVLVYLVMWIALPARPTKVA